MMGGKDTVFDKCISCFAWHFKVQSAKICLIVS